LRNVPHIAALALATGLLALAGPNTLAQSPSTSPPTDTSQTAAHGQPEVVGYDLRTVTIEQPSQARLNPDFVEMPVHLQGIVAVPEGEGPFPVALLMHGSYPSAPPWRIPGGTHNGFSTKLEPERGPQCQAKGVIDPEDQRAIAATLLPQFFDLALSIEDR
jgi:hypothetical protein